MFTTLAVAADRTGSAVVVVGSAGSSDARRRVAVRIVPGLSPGR
ncbi:hypothetical protein V6N00_05275 [Tersicoccus sp. MR15.9]